MYNFISSAVKTETADIYGHFSLDLYVFGAGNSMVMSAILLDITGSRKSKMAAVNWKNTYFHIFPLLNTIAT